MSSSNSQVKKKLRQEVTTRGEISSPGGNTVGALCDIVQVKGEYGRRQLFEVLDDLESRNEIKIVRENGQIRSVGPGTPSVRNRAHVDRTEMSPWQKRERTFAKGVPSVLPDHLVGPLVVTHKPVESRDDPVIEPQVAASKARMTLIQQLDLAYAALRLLAEDAPGNIVPSARVIETIQTELSCSAATGYTLLRRLREIGLLAHERKDRRGFYFVSSDVESITDEMLQRAVAIVDLEFESEREAQSESTDGAAQSPMQMLIEIIDDLESQLASQKSENERITSLHRDVLADSTRDIESLRQQLTDARATIAHLETQQSLVPEGEVTTVLKRYGKLKE